MQPHWPPHGDLVSLVEVLARAVEVAARGAPQRAGEKAAGEAILLAIAAQIVHGFPNLRAGRRFAA
jgi:hypothetical protein